MHRFSADITGQRNCRLTLHCNDDGVDSLAVFARVQPSRQVGAVHQEVFMGLGSLSMAGGCATLARTVETESDNRIKSIICAP